MIDSDINRKSAGGHHEGTHITSIPGTHSGDISSDNAPDAAGASNEHDHGEDEIESKGRNDTMKGRTAPTLTALALAAILGLITVVDAKAANVNVKIIDGVDQNAIGEIGITIDNNIVKEDIIEEININNIQRINSDDINGASAGARIVIDNNTI